MESDVSVRVREDDLRKGSGRVGECERETNCVWEWGKGWRRLEREIEW